MFARRLYLVSLSACLWSACGDDEGVAASLGTGSATTAASAGSGSSGSSSGSSSEGSSGSATTADTADTADTTADTSGDPTTGSTGSDTGSPTTGSTGSDTADTGSTTAAPAECGNGVIDRGEQCDGEDFGGFDCMGLGYSGGSISCDPVMCILDSSMCEMGDSTGGTGG